MILFTERPDFREAWEKTTFRVLMGGMGDDTAMLIAELFQRGYEPDEIVFCDTGSEFKYTYEFIDFLKNWCGERKWSKVVVLNKTDKEGNPLSVIGSAEKDYTLPAAAFGSKACSLRFKVETADVYFNNHPKAWSAWGVKGKGKHAKNHTGAMLRMVGINAHETRRTAGWKPEHKWVQVYPLVDLEIGEKESKAVEEVGLYYPGKSSCYCCPHLNGKEIYQLKVLYPEDYKRIKDLEDNYILANRKPDSSTIGLCRGKTIEEKMSEYTENGLIRGEGGCDICANQ